jgi:hypothetical protein
MGQVVDVGRIPTCSQIALFAAIAIAPIANAGDGADPQSTDRRRLLAESDGGAIKRACAMPNCAVVLAVRHAEVYESGPVVQSRAPLTANPLFGVFDPHVAPVLRQPFLVQRRKDVWIIEVQRPDGTVQVFRQSYPALFRPGDVLLVEGDRLRAMD